MSYLPEKRSGALARALAKKMLAAGEHPISHRPEADKDDPSQALEDDRSFASLVQTALSRTSRAADERAAAPALLAELLALPLLEREAAVVVDPRYQTYALASYTLERCEKAAATYDPALA